MTELMDGLHLHEEAVSAEMQADLLAFVEAQLSDGRHGTGALTAKTYTAPPDTWIASGQVTRILSLSLSLCLRLRLRLRLSLSLTLSLSPTRGSRAARHVNPRRVNPRFVSPRPVCHALSYALT